MAASSCLGMECISSIITHPNLIFREEIRKIKISRGSGAGGKSLFETDSEVGSDVVSLEAGGDETNMDLSDLDENINTDLKEAVGVDELLDSEDEWTLSKYYGSKD